MVRGRTPDSSWTRCWAPARAARRVHRSRSCSSGCSISRYPIVAVDGPTGVDLGTGIVHGAPRADLTVTFGGLRRGHLLARDEVGTVVVTDIGHPPADAAWPLLVTDDDAAGWLRRLTARDHKGSRGRVVVVGGDIGNDRRGAPGVSRGLRGGSRPGARGLHAVDRRGAGDRGARPPDLRASVRSRAERAAARARRQGRRRRHRSRTRPGAGQAGVGGGAGRARHARRCSMPTRWSRSRGPPRQLRDRSPRGAPAC